MFFSSAGCSACSVPCRSSRIRSRSDSVSQGLGIKYAAPSRMASSAVRSLQKAEITTNCVLLFLGARRMRPKPSSPGNTISASTNSGSCSSIRRRASIPSPTEPTTVNSPVFSIAFCKSLRNSSLASASRTRLLISFSMLYCSFTIQIYWTLSFFSLVTDS